MKHPEILAPAGSFDSLIAAVQCGANAVYLGGKGMNARRNAGNFDAEELRRAVEYCHLRGVKVYQTINIVMFEDEIDEAVETIRTAAEAGVDAVLTQDLAVARMVRECAPTLPVHASTQMTSTTSRAHGSVRSWAFPGWYWPGSSPPPRSVISVKTPRWKWRCLSMARSVCRCRDSAISVR